ncbi:D-tyrosyl-tRNA(Tyr) deacylase [Linnemannia zychae]|nr:D-tyrosyl-tRNA(Tyr) deacylase [Linnemannia zychae]
MEFDFGKTAVDAVIKHAATLEVLRIESKGISGGFDIGVGLHQPRDSRFQIYNIPRPYITRLKTNSSTRDCTIAFGTSEEPHCEIYSKRGKLIKLRELRLGFKGQRPAYREKVYRDKVRQLDYPAMTLESGLDTLKDLKELRVVDLYHMEVGINNDAEKEWVARHRPYATIGNPDTMRAASVEVNGQQISKIHQGLCVLIGLSVDDTPADLDYMVKKLLSVRVFDSNQHAIRTPGVTMTRPPREQGQEQQGGEVQEQEQEPAKMWAKSVVDIEGEILCVSQFTLYGQVLKGSKPDFHLSMKSETSKQMYHDFLARLKKAYKSDRIKDGEFGAMMLVNIANDGPVTLELDSRKFEYSPITHQSNPAVFKALKAAAAAAGTDVEQKQKPVQGKSREGGGGKKDKQEKQEKHGNTVDVGVVATALETKLKLDAESASATESAPVVEVPDVKAA